MSTRIEGIAEATRGKAQAAANQDGAVRVMYAVYRQGSVMMNGYLTVEEVKRLAAPTQAWMDSLLKYGNHMLDNAKAAVYCPVRKACTNVGDTFCFEVVTPQS